MSAMITAFEGKKNKDQETALVVTVQDQVVQTQPEESGSIVTAISSMIARNKAIFKLPTINRSNISILTSAVLGGATQIADTVSPTIKCEANPDSGTPNPSTIVAASVATIGSVVSGGVQFSDYWTRIRQLQAAQEAFVNLAMPYIVMAQYKDGETLTTIDKPYTAEKLIQIMQRKGHISLKLSDAETVAFVYSSICSWQTAITFGLSALPVLFAALQVADSADAIQLGDDPTQRAVLLAATSTPYAKCYDKLMQMIHKNELALLEAYQKLAAIYQDESCIHKLTREAMLPICAFLSPDRADILLTQIDRAKTAALEDSELGLGQRPKLTLTNRA